MATNLAFAPETPETTSLRPALAGGLAFLEGCATPDWSIQDLCRWFSEHLIAPGFMMTPLTVTEAPVGTIPLYGSAADSHSLRKLLVAARCRVLTQLRALSSTPPDDRFLSAAIFAGRVWRHRVNGRTQWVARPEPTTPLSAIVLSLFAVDVLSNREEYSRLLSVCEVCDRVTFHEASHRSCREHLPHVSGVMRKVTLPRSG